MTLDTVRKIGNDIDIILKLKTPATGIHLFKSKDEIPVEFQQMDVPVPFCSIAGLSRFYELPVTIDKITAADTCIGFDYAFGWRDLPEGFAEQMPGLFSETAENAEKIISSMLRLDDAFEAVGAAPLKDSPRIPEVIQVWCNPLQLSVLVYANTWFHPDERVVMGTNGHGGSCYEALVVPYVEQRLNISIVDMGDRKHGHSGDDEIIMGIPLSKLEKLYVGILCNQETRHRLPVMYDFESTPFPVPEKSLQRKGPNFR